jgi:hypothetical protein
MAKGSGKGLATKGDRLPDLPMNDATGSEAVKGGVTKVEENRAEKERLRAAQRALESL